MEQLPEETSKLQMGNKCKYNRNNSIGFMLFDRKICNSSMARSKHAYILNPEPNQTCRAITGYMKPTNVKDLVVLARISQTDIRRDVCPTMEIAKQVNNE